ncbi:MAG: amino acid racemase [Nitrososphaerota archaeon]|nr:amino acid racemase [Candidatus Bathyarchaeota archaeon]MDW8024047.1 amino acid racemase [Nitrososphaerota archaeon]MDW8040560.1 amino acid racemase [Nitrososphaerota archaeon]
MKEKVIGILGGMGPEATVELFHRIVKETPAKRDQEHLRIIVYNNPKIPDRTAAILGIGENPLPEMVRTAKNLENSGVDFIVMPCITAHYYIEELQRNVSVPVLNMVELTAKALAGSFPEVKKVGLLGTTGTFKGRVFDKALGKFNVKVIYPSDEGQKKVMEAIYGCIKAGKISEGRKIVVEEANRLVNAGADAVICGCTEISLVLKDGDVAKPVIDPLQILARSAVLFALGKIKI